MALIAALFAHQLHATPWVKTDDPYLQQSLQQLANAGLITTPVNTWPVMWQPILQDLANIDVNQLSAAQQQAFYRIQSAASFSQQAQIKTLAVQGSTDPLGEQALGTQHQQQGLISLGAELKGGNWAAGVFQQVRTDSYDANEYSENKQHWDNSYAAYTAGNWVLIAALQPQWWGPAIHSSFNFNNQQRPTRSVQLSRLNPNTPLLNNLAWLGPVSFNIQVGSFAGTSPLRHANYAASRLGIKPFSKLELGFSARNVEPNFTELPLQQPYSTLLPQDNLRTFGADMRYHVSEVAALYAEVSYQQADKSATGWLVGSHYHLGNDSVLIRFFAEYQQLPEHYNQWLFIEHGAEVAPIDNEWVMGLQLTTPSGKAGYLKLSQSNYQLNDNNLAQLKRAVALHLGYQQPLWNSLLKLDYQLQKTDNLSDNIDFNHAIGARWEWRW
ncbi:capsule assembly Wzi family protein [Alishewanella sp. HL-SH06]|uniref:capsule assembly Wzi family protein n=1 Tax=Alishewanella sp. HL-SH06 TaxID=3461144 RepID=UPI004043745A